MKPSAGWYPVKLESPRNGEITLTWQDLSAADFTAPFFEDTINQARHQRPELRQTSLHELGAIPLSAAVPPSAFIFHTSRSGSTLLMQLLSCLDGSIALSEPPIIDALLHLDLSDAEKILVLRQVVQAIGQAHSAGDRHFFVKYDSWHLPWLPLIREAFPTVPCFFIYRHPVEILWSHHRQRGSQMVPGLRDLQSLNLVTGCDHPADLDAFAGRVLEAIFTQALPHIRKGKLIPLGHHQLVAKIETTLVEHLGITLSKLEQERIHHRSHFHSKRREDRYSVEDEGRMPAALRERFEALTAPILMPIFFGLAPSE